MKQIWFGYVIIGAVTFGSVVSPAMAQQQNPPKQQPAQQQRPAQQPQTYVPAHPSASSQLNTAAQSPVKAAGTFDGTRGSQPTTVNVQPSTTTVNAATIAAQQNAAERARQAEANRKVNLDNRPVPSPGSH